MAIYNGTQKIDMSGVAKVYVGTQLVYQKTVDPEWIEQYSSTNSTYGGRYISFDNGTNWTKVTSSSDPYYLRAYSQRIWTDGTYLYSSEGAGKHYKFNDTTKVWDAITWNVDVYGDRIWTDGTDIFFSDINLQYKLNLSTGEWETHTWSSGGTTEIAGNQIWTDGTDIYFSGSNGIYVYNRTNNNWTAVTFINYPAGTSTYQIWSDGIDNYYSSGTTHKVLDKSTRTWSDMTWNGLINFAGTEVMHWNNKIYVRQGTSPYNFYELNVATHTWTLSAEMLNPLTSSKNQFRGARMLSKHGRIQNGAQPFTYRQ